MRWLVRFIVRTFAVLVFATLALAALFTYNAYVRERVVHRELVPPGGRFVRADELDLFVQEAGPANGPAVLFVHGTGAWSEIWRRPMDRLAAAGYRAIAIDLPPFGFSERPGTPRYATGDQARRIAAIVRALGLKQVTLVGHSFGARATVEAAFQLKTQVQALVLVDAALDLKGAPPPSGWAARTLEAVLAVDPVRHVIVASTVTNPLLTGTFLKMLIDDPADATDAMVDMLKRPLAMRDSTARVAEWLQPFLFTQEAGVASADPANYRAFAAPTLLLWGERDRLAPLLRAHDLKDLLPNATLTVLNRAGHIPHVEDAEQFSTALLGFLTKRVPVR